jgi:hypothetical protein
MLKSILKNGVLTLLACTILSAPTHLNAQNDEMPAAEKKETRSNRVTPFHGKLRTVDKDARTISVGELTIQVTSDTRIMKDGKPATLEDGTLEEIVAGAYRKTEDGKLQATMVRFGAKPESENERSKKNQ